MKRILFGDNQFFGVNHMSEEKARAQSMRFKDIDAVIQVLDNAYELGINTFMCTTHDRISEVCDHVRNNPEKYPDFEFYPCMPYAHKYANALGELGVMGTLKKYTSGNIIELMAKGAVAGSRQDIEQLMKMLVDSEMKMFSGLKTGVIFLQNVVTDLILGLGLAEIFKTFSDYIAEKYQAEAGFITMNMPRLLDSLESVGLENPIICSNFNKIGFRMCGGIELYEKAVRERQFRAVAMSVFASGAIPPREAIEYIGAQKSIDSVVFGASSRANIAETKRLIEELL